jgi:hypothetical protein
LLPHATGTSENLILGWANVDAGSGGAGRTEPSMCGDRSTLSGIHGP